MGTAASTTPLTHHERLAAYAAAAAAAARSHGRIKVSSRSASSCTTSAQQPPPERLAGGWPEGHKRFRLASRREKRSQEADGLPGRPIRAASHTGTFGRLFRTGGHHGTDALAWIELHERRGLGQGERKRLRRGRGCCRVPTGHRLPLTRPRLWLRLRRACLSGVCAESLIPGSNERKGREEREEEGEGRKTVAEEASTRDTRLIAARGEERRERESRVNPPAPNEKGRGGPLRGKPKARAGLSASRRRALREKGKCTGEKGEGNEKIALARDAGRQLESGASCREGSTVAQEGPVPQKLRKSNAETIHNYNGVTGKGASPHTPGLNT